MARYVVVIRCLPKVRHRTSSVSRCPRLRTWPDGTGGAVSPSTAIATRWVSPIGHVVAAARLESGEIPPDDLDVGVIRTRRCQEDVKGSRIARAGVAEAPLPTLDRREIVEGDRETRRFRPERPLLDRRRPPVQGFGLVQAPPSLGDRGEVVEDDRKFPMARAERALEAFGAVSEHGLGISRRSLLVEDRGEGRSIKDGREVVGLPNVDRYLTIIEKVEEYFSMNNLYFKIYLINQDGDVEVSNLNKKFIKDAA